MEDGEARDEEGREEEEHEPGEIFADYRPIKLPFGRPHPDSAVETASLAAVDPPDISYQLHINDLVESGQLSGLQLESIVYACQRHEQHLPSGDRCGFFIGDGAPWSLSRKCQSSFGADIHQAQAQTQVEHSTELCKHCISIPTQALQTLKPLCSMAGQCMCCVAEVSAAAAPSLPVFCRCWCWQGAHHSWPHLGELEVWAHTALVDLCGLRLEGGRQEGSQ